MALRKAAPTYPRYVPRTFEAQRAAFITTFLGDLERPYNGFLTTQLNQVVGKNEAITGAPCYYLGDTVYARGLTMAKVGKHKFGGMATLDPSLEGQHEDFLCHYTEHKEGWQRLSQSLRVILLAAANWQELRDMLPEHVLRPYLEHGALADLTRTRVDLHTAHLRFQESSSQTCSWDALLIDQYVSISDKVDLYVGYRLL